MITTVTSALVFSAALAAVAFVARYARVKWSKSGLGWSVMGLWVAFAFILGLAASTEIWGDWLGRVWVRFFVYLLINVVMWSQVWQLYAGQRAARRDRREARNRANVS